MTDVERLEACLAALRSWCREAKVAPTGDGRVGEETAAQLIGISPDTLANWRSEGKAPEHFRIGGPGYRVSYELRTIAAWIQARRV